ncbi:LuxR family transcriptional regulator [Bosea sp. Root483D1]|uniref:helix-turn-helix transcriptional regulator n=1 Tax=Bosea sp. Root483D1 TaxID=1736544 RepID=UPI00070FE686|nr:helix-turn-helix transcriptional regulator [Bosea sp. Root483D1]KRE18337.1 LuxR family transcriptional regulator [Bosea sp. Root483D1]
MDERFLDSLYEAAVVPELWPQVLRRFQEIARAAGAVLVAVTPSSSRWISSSSEFDQIVSAHFNRFPGNERTRRLLERRHAGFLRDIDILSDAEMASEPVYRDFLLPQGLGIGVATSIVSPTGEAFILHAERERGEGDVENGLIARFDRMRPHLARAMLLSARLEFERAQGATRALEAIGLPAAILDREGRALALNPRFEAMIPSVAVDRPSRLGLVDAAADGLLAAALQARGQITGGTVRSIPVARRENQPPLILHLTPIRGAAHDIFSRAASILVVTPVVVKDVPTADVVQGLFDLTPAEARLAALIAAGHRPREAAAALGVMEETARSTLKRVMAKTGLHRQADLIGLLRGAGVTGGASGRD